MAAIKVGSYTRTAATTHVVNRWHIPNGSDYHMARVVNLFFGDEQAAIEYQKEYRMPPEMADLMTVAKYDDLMAASSKSYSQYKKRFQQDFDK